MWLEIDIVHHNYVGPEENSPNFLLIAIAIHQSEYLAWYSNIYNICYVYFTTQPSHNFLVYIMVTNNKQDSNLPFFETAQKV